jgi:hypothetical protein
MATEDPTWSQTESPASEDRRTERAVLGFLLVQHPTRLTSDELLRAFDPKDFAEKDAIARAVGELTGAGLLHREGELLSPSRSALHFDRLESS